MAEALSDNLPAKADGKPPLFGLSFLENLSEMTMLRQVGPDGGPGSQRGDWFCRGAVVAATRLPPPCTAACRAWIPSRSRKPSPPPDIAYTVEPNSGALLVKADDVARASDETGRRWRGAVRQQYRF